MRSREDLGQACGFHEVITPLSASLAARKGARMSPYRSASPGAAAAEVLSAMVGANRPFQHTSTSAPGAGPDATLTRSYVSVLDAARENAFARMLVRIHFRCACTVGLQQGRDVARCVLEQAPFLHA
jgi:hypothetical protein